MVNNKAYLVVMAICLDPRLVIQNILKVLVVLIRLLLDLITIQQKSCPPFWASLYACSQSLFPLEFVV